MFLDRPSQANNLPIHLQERPYFGIVFSCTLKSELFLDDISNKLKKLALAQLNGNVAYVSLFCTEIIL